MATLAGAARRDRQPSRPVHGQCRGSGPAGEPPGAAEPDRRNHEPGRRLLADRGVTRRLGPPPPPPPWRAGSSGAVADCLRDCRRDCRRDSGAAPIGRMGRRAIRGRMRSRAGGRLAPALRGDLMKARAVPGEGGGAGPVTDLGRVPRDEQMGVRLRRRRRGRDVANCATCGRQGRQPRGVSRLGLLPCHRASPHDRGLHLFLRARPQSYIRGPIPRIWGTRSRRRWRGSSS